MCKYTFVVYLLSHHKELLSLLALQLKVIKNPPLITISMCLESLKTRNQAMSHNKIIIQPLARCLVTLIEQAGLILCSLGIVPDTNNETSLCWLSIVINDYMHRPIMSRSFYSFHVFPISRKKLGILPKHGLPPWKQHCTRSTSWELFFQSTCWKRCISGTANFEVKFHLLPHSNPIISVKNCLLLSILLSSIIFWNINLGILLGP